MTKKAKLPYRSTISERRRRLAVMFLTLFLPLMCLVLLIYILLSANEAAKVKTERQAEAVKTLALLQNDLSQRVRAVSADLRTLSSIIEITLTADLSVAEDQSLEKILARPAYRDIMTSYALSARSYDRIRFIDTSGRELIRIRYGEGAIAQDEELGFVDDVKELDALRALRAGDVFLGELFIREGYGQRWGQSEVPVMTFSTPIIAGRDGIVGYISFDYLAGHTLNAMAARLNDYDLEVLLVSGVGSKLRLQPDQRVGVEEFRRWESTNLATERPELWQILRSRDTGSVRLDNGDLVIFNLLRLVNEAQINPMRVPQADIKRLIQPGANSNRWLLVGRFPSEVFLQVEASTRRQYLPLLMLTTAMLGGICLVVANSRLQQELLAGERALALQESRKLALIASRTTNAALIMKPDGRIIWLNEGFTRLTGYTLNNLKPGFAVTDLISPQSPVGSGSPEVAVAISARRSFRGEVLCERISGAPFWMSLEVQPVFNERAEVINYIAVGQDTTERRYQEEQLRKAKIDAEAATRAKSDFLANMSHEIRTPMNAIIGMTGLLLDTPLNKEQREYVDVVRTSSNSLLGLISDILDFSKIEAGKLDFDKADFDLRQCVEEVGDLLAQRAQAKGLEYSILIRNTVPKRLRGDSGRLRQVLLNLVTNAVKFTEHGEVNLIVDMVESPEESQFRLRFEVEDSGPGISETGLERLFKSFSQVDASTTRRYGGTGLGLAISKQLVHLMGGEIGVKSLYGRGSTFWFELPFEAPIESSPAVSDDSFSLRGKCVLIVDNHATTRRALRELLASMQCSCVEVDNATSALTTLSQEGQCLVDAILLNHRLTEMSGCELARKIRDIPGYHQIPIILLTTIPERAHLADTEIPDLDGYLLKPVKQSMLAQQLKNVFMQMGRSDEYPKLKAALTPVSIAKAPTEPAERIRVLLVEDNLVNQKVAVKILEKMNIRVDVASNGLEALRSFQRLPYDLILMDCQMPEMDGYEATDSIRKLEAGESRIPIIAMTAEAMEGDRERCIAAGMDDYLTKPMNTEKLMALIHQYAPKKQKSIVAAPAMQRSRSAIFDVDRLYEISAGDAQTERDILSLFCRTMDQLMAQLCEAEAAQDYEAAAKALHAIRGAATNIGATMLADRCIGIENQIRNSFGIGCHIQMEAPVRREYDRLTTYLKAQPALKAALSNFNYSV